MKLLRRVKGKCFFQLGRREKDLLLSVLSLYPRIPSEYQRLSKVTSVDEASQKLLEDALADQRAENKRRLQALLTESGRFVKHENGWRLALSLAELEWLLQILNDVRVGSWLVLGSPETRFEAVTEKTAPHIWAMEMAGGFQMEFLAAIGDGKS